MNRAERRRIQKAQEKVHVVTHDDMMFEKGFQVGLRQGILKESGLSTRMLITSTALILHREFGFGKTRLERVLRHISDTLETIQDDPDREKRMRAWIKEKLDVDLDDYTGGRMIELREELQDLYDMGKKVK